MQILVTGAAGQLGSGDRPALRLARGRLAVTRADLDIADTAAVERVRRAGMRRTW